jgi:threonine synthase
VAGLLQLAERDEVPPGLAITVTVTGHGLKDIDTALSALPSFNGGPIEAEVVPAELDAVAQACGF